MFGWKSLSFSCLVVASLTAPAYAQYYNRPYSGNQPQVPLLNTPFGTLGFNMNTPGMGYNQPYRYPAYSYPQQQYSMYPRTVYGSPQYVGQPQYTVQPAQAVVGASYQVTPAQAMPSAEVVTQAGGVMTTSSPGVIQTAYAPPADGSVMYTGGGMPGYAQAGDGCGCSGGGGTAYVEAAATSAPVSKRKLRKMRRR